MSGHEISKGVFVSQLGDLNILHSIVVNELKQHDVSTKNKKCPTSTILTKSVLKFIYTFFFFIIINNII